MSGFLSGGRSNVLWCLDCACGVFGAVVKVANEGGCAYLFFVRSSSSRISPPNKLPIQLLILNPEIKIFILFLLPNNRRIHIILIQKLLLIFLHELSRRIAFKLTNIFILALPRAPDLLIPLLRSIMRNISIGLHHKIIPRQLSFRMLSQWEIILCCVLRTFKLIFLFYFLGFKICRWIRDFQTFLMFLIFYPLV